jgi:hypothetical protein
MADESAVENRRARFDLADAGAEAGAMALHLIKLCVGCDSIADLAEWIDYRLDEARRAGRPPEHVHVTRMVPRRIGDLLDGGSLYWVIKGNVQVRQRLIDVQPFTDEEGIQRCRLVLQPKLVATAWQPRRPFQGWRYLKPADAPADLKKGRSSALPPALEAELAALGVR